MNITNNPKRGRLLSPIFSFFLIFGSFISFVTFSVPQAEAATLMFANNTGSSITANTSANWSGYLANSGTYTSVAGTWTVPQVSPTANSPVNADATWVGLGGVTGKDLIQTGTMAVVSNGQVTYDAWYELLPSTSQQIPLSVTPGNSITGSISQEGTNQFLVSLRNNTTGQSYQTTVSYASSLSSAEWIEEAPLNAQTNSFMPIDNFGSTSFTNATATENGALQNLAGVNAQPINLINTSGVALAVPSTIGTDNQSFTVTRTSAAAGTASLNSSGGLPMRRFVRTATSVQTLTPGQQQITIYRMPPGNTFGPRGAGMGMRQNYVRIQLFYNR